MTHSVLLDLSRNVMQWNLHYPWIIAGKIAVMVRRSADPTEPTEIGLRLKISRQALGFTTTFMCKMMGSISHGSAYTNYEMGRRTISIRHALELCARCRLTLAWIYQGQLDTLPADIREKILQLMPDDDHGSSRKRASG